LGIGQPAAISVGAGFARLRERRRQPRIAGLPRSIRTR